MTQSIREAAQALLDAYAENGPYRHLHISTARVALQDAMTSPQPTADERVEYLIDLVESYGEACAAEQRAKFRGERVHTRHDLPAMLGAVEQSARSLLSESQDDAEHAAMYRWLRDNKSNSLHLTRNGDHACNYMTASQWIEENQDWFAGTNKEELEKMKETNTIWDLQIYPKTPVGFNIWSAATLCAAIRAAMKESK